MSELIPFQINIADEVLADLRHRLSQTRWPDQIPGTGWDLGAELTAVQRLCAYWENEFDWRAAEARLNEWPQFKTEIDGQTIHFAHIRSPHENALPLVMTHGWPGSIAEFLKVVGPLTNPTAHGGQAEDAFHLVLPSIAGYGFSGPTNELGWNTARVAASTKVLMARLGYERYAAQGGDWGAIITSQLGAQDPDHVVGIHINMVAVGPANSDNPMEGVLPEEVPGLERMGAFRLHGVGYQAIQGTCPQSLAYGLTDSPAGLCGWILEKFRQWSDCNGDPFSVFTMDELCTNLMIYWATSTINSSMRLYFETIGPTRQQPMPKVTVPTAAAMFPKEIFQAPRAWAAAQYNLQQWSRFEVGGHFAAMEQPEALVQDVRTFFANFR